MWCSVLLALTHVYIYLDHAGRRDRSCILKRENPHSRCYRGPCSVGWLDSGGSRGGKQFLHLVVVSIVEPPPGGLTIGNAITRGQLGHCVTRCLGVTNNKDIFETKLLATLAGDNDEWDRVGLAFATMLRSLPNANALRARHAIEQILFEAQMSVVASQ